MKIRPKLLVSLLLGVILAAACWVRIDFIWKSLPYVGHVDERVITLRAIKILKKGDYNPRNFQYPSLPIYLTSASFAAGYSWAAARGDVPSLRKVGSVSYPYYTHKRIVFPAKILLAVLSVLTLGLAGLTALRMYGRTELLILAPLVLLVSGLFLRHSWVYINVDMFGAFFGALTVWAALCGMNRPGYLPRAVLPGILAGLTYACKYNYGVVLLSPLLAVWLSGQDRRIKASLVAAGSSALAFFIAVPYSLLDPRTFANGVFKQIRVYSTGHKGFEGPPGLPQLLHYVNHLVTEYGAMLCLFALLGLVCSLMHHRRQALVVFSFPLGLLALMSLQKVNFVRNILPLHVFFAVAAAYGWTWSRQTATDLLSRRFPNRRRILQVSVVVLLASAAAATIPWSRVGENYSVSMDSRNLAVTWVLENLPHGTRIQVPTEMVLDTRPLRGKYRITPITLKEIKHLNDVEPDGILILPYFRPDYRRKGGEEAERLNRLFAPIPDLASFGSRPVTINYFHRHAGTRFDPRFRIVWFPVDGA